jgi:hypothetical protein
MAATILIGKPIQTQNAMTYALIMFLVSRPKDVAGFMIRLDAKVRVKRSIWMVGPNFRLRPYHINVA